MVAYSAIHKAGAVAVPTNIRLTDSELGHLLGHAEVKAMLTDTELAPAASRVAAGLPTVSHVLTAPAPASRSHRRPATPGPGARPAVTTTARFQVALDAEDLADILYTSGTTGLPKGVAIRHRNVALIPGDPNPSYSGNSWLHSSPLFTFAGIGFIYNPMQLGLFGVFQPRFDAGRWLQIVAELKPHVRLPGPLHGPADRHPRDLRRRPTSTPSRSAPSVPRRWPPPPCGPSRSGCRRRPSPTPTG